MNKFKEYLDSREESFKEFANRTYIAPNTVSKLYHGKQVRRDIAKWVVKVTKGEITLEDLGFGT
jgi:predicted transcriptional regulator